MADKPVVTPIDGSQKIKDNYTQIYDNDLNLKNSVDATIDEVDTFQQQLTDIVNETDLDPNKDPEVTTARDSDLNGEFDTVKQRLDYAESDFNSRIEDLVEKNEQVDKTNAPGPKFLLEGDMNYGFFGFVPAKELFTGTELASEIGLTDGTAQNSDSHWIKYIV